MYVLTVPYLLCEEMDRWMDGWMDRWMDGWMDNQVLHYSSLLLPLVLCKLTVGHLESQAKTHRHYCVHSWDFLR